MNEAVGMSRLFAITRPLTEIAAHFNAAVTSPTDVPAETVEGMPGLIVFEKDGVRILKSIPWGFPRKSRSAREGDDPSERIGLVADLTNPLWDRLVLDPKYRCLIPLTHFANPDGVKGKKTRTWFSLLRQPIVALAGFCRNTPELGPVFAGMTGKANEKIRPFNDRMPILLKPEEWDKWLHGSIQDVIAFQFREPTSSDDFVIMPTRDRWRSGVPPVRSSVRPVNMVS